MNHLSFVALPLRHVRPLINISVLPNNYLLSGYDYMLLYEHGIFICAGVFPSSVPTSITVGYVQVFHLSLPALLLVPWLSGKVAASRVSDRGLLPASLGQVMLVI